MKIQSLSIAVPAGCPNLCKFCVSHMHKNQYDNRFIDRANITRALDEYRKRLEFAKEQGCSTIMITGSGEPLMNSGFLEIFGTINKTLSSPFRWIELQTSGVGLNDKMLSLLSAIGVSTISLSLSDVFSSSKNAETNQTTVGLEINIDELCKKIKEAGFNLRLSLNMTNQYDNVSVEKIFQRVKELEANQVTFRKLYTSGMGGSQDQWVEENKCSDQKMNEIQDYILKNGRSLRTLEFGATVYSINEVSTVIDNDCMNVNTREDGTVKYLILRPDCRLYSHWDDKGSLIF